MSRDNRSDSPHRPATPGADLSRSFLLVLLGVLGAAAGYWAYDHFRGRPAAAPLLDPDARPRDATPAGPLDAEEREAVDLFKKLRPSVVNVDVVQRQRVGWDDRIAERQTGGGSGFVWDDDGRVVTNYHVIADLYRTPNVIVRVTLADRTGWDAVVVAKAEQYDLAVLRFAPHNRPPADKVRKIDLGTSADLLVGQKAYAIGNPFGLSLTMTKGIISALDRTIESPARTPIPGAIQVDAAINPGNSGGPLLDKAGRLIGVNTAITTPAENGGNVGIGFAIPADLVNQVVTQMIQSGRALRPDFGVALLDQQKLRRARYDHGVMVERVAPGGPADQAGVVGIRFNPRTGRADQLGDLVLAVNDEPVESHADFERAVRKCKPGDRAKLRVTRFETADDNGRKVVKEAEREVTLTVGGA